jgi:Leucine-rich repeat (LRR) protein
LTKRNQQQLKMKLFLIIILIIKSYSIQIKLSNNCPNSFECQYDEEALELVVVRENNDNALTFNLPTNDSYNDLTRTRSITIKFSGKLPDNLCSFGPSLINLDLSNNFLTGQLNNSDFECLTSLQYLNLSNNFITNIDKTTFDNLYILISLDLSYNKINQLPDGLFDQQKLRYLRQLRMSHNLITNLDPWYFYLERIDHIDLSYNQISRLTNNINWDLNNQQFYPRLAYIQTFDLSNNQLQYFNDQTILKLYKLCDYIKFTIWLHLMYHVRLDNNPFQCDCSQSFNLLQFYSNANTSNVINTDQYLFRSAKCSSPSKYNGIANVYN